MDEIRHTPENTYGVKVGGDANPPVFPIQRLFASREGQRPRCPNLALPTDNTKEPVFLILKFLKNDFAIKFFLFPSRRRS